MVRRVIVAIFVLVLAAAAGSVAGCGGGVPGDAVAKVGDVLIKESDLEQRVKEFAVQYGVADEATDPEGWASFKLDVLDYLVTYQMAVQKAEGFGIAAVTDEEVQTEIDNIVTNYYEGDEAKFTAALTDSGMTLESLKASYKENMLLEKVWNKVTEGVTEVPEDEIAAYYEENKADYFVDETRTARHILIKPGAEETTDTTATTEWTDADWAKALATANEVRTLLVAGGDWAELATEYSDDPGSSASGGDLGDVSPGEMVQEFNDALFSLTLNEISQPVKTAFGYHIIQATAINPAEQSTLDEVKEGIKTILLEQKQQEAWQKWIADTKVELNVIYQEGMQTTTTAAESTATTLAEDTTSTSAGQTITTAATTTTTVVKP